MIILSWYLIGNVPCECDFFLLLNLGQEARRAELTVSLVELNFQTETQLQK